MIADRCTITGDDWAVSLRAARARRAVHTAAMVAYLRDHRAKTTFPAMTNGTASQPEEMRKAAETPEAHGDSSLGQIGAR